ncbi:MAG: type II secretion system F family protein [Candidatus Hydrogenedentota bacterium]|nr:MAG: type II secretion system F family protein [Candidatus Hydrogenedentota bacterium]
MVFRRHSANKKIIFRQRVSDKDLLIFTRILLTLLKARLPLDRALLITRDQTENEFFRGILSSIHHDVTAGVPLSQALAKHPRTFRPVYVNLVRAGETSGQLPEMLARVYAFQEKSIALKSKIITALAYPIVVLLVSFLILGAFLIYLVPRLKSTILKHGTALPLPTRVVLGISDFLTHNLFTFPNNLLLLISSVVLIYLLTRTRNIPQFQEFRDRFLLRTPIWGALLTKTLTARFASTLALLMASGVNIVDALAVVSQVLENVVFMRTAQSIESAISQGISFSQALSDQELFPKLMSELSAAGEETGELPEMLVQAAEFFESEVDLTLRIFTAVLEPIAIVFIVALLGGVVISLYLPMLKIRTV